MEGTIPGRTGGGDRVRSVSEPRCRGRGWGGGWGTHGYVREGRVGLGGAALLEEVCGGGGPADVVALGEIAAEVGEEVEGGAFFYSFGDDA